MWPSLYKPFSIRGLSVKCRGARHSPFIKRHRRLPRSLARSLANPYFKGRLAIPKALVYIQVALRHSAARKLHGHAVSMYFRVRWCSVISNMIQAGHVYIYSQIRHLSEMCSYNYEIYQPAQVQYN